MKTTNRYKVTAGNIHSMKDLEMEKKRLRLEILKTETYIQSDYHNLLHAFTFRNLASTVIEDLSATTNVVSKAFAVGKALFGRKKKKHKTEPVNETP